VILLIPNDSACHNQLFFTWNLMIPIDSNDSARFYGFRVILLILSDSIDSTVIPTLQDQFTLGSITRNLAILVLVFHTEIQQRTIKHIYFTALRLTYNLNSWDDLTGYCNDSYFVRIFHPIFLPHLPCDVLSYVYLVMFLSYDVYLVMFLSYDVYLVMFLSCDVFIL
jgi:hypothetical protein